MPEPALLRDFEPSIVPVALKRAGVFGGHIPALLKAPHCMWLNPLLDSGNSFGAVIYESAFASADVDCCEFLHICKIEDLPVSFADVERSQYQNVWNDSDYAAFNGLRNSNAFRRLKERELPKN